MSKDCQINRWKGCCCECKRQERIQRHPWNKPPFKGKISELLGYGCTVFLVEDCGIIFSDSKHGLCEMFSRKP